MHASSPLSEGTPPVVLGELLLLLVDEALDGAGDTPDALDRVALVHEGKVLRPNDLPLFLVHLHLLLEQPLQRLDVVVSLVLLDLRARVRTHKVAGVYLVRGVSGKSSMGLRDPT